MCIVLLLCVYYVIIMLVYSHLYFYVIIYICRVYECCYLCLLLYFFDVFNGTLSIIEETSDFPLQIASL